MGTTLLAGTSLADPSDANLIEGGARGDAPAEAVDVTQVDPFPFVGEQSVAAGDWIEHTVGLGTEDRESLAETQDELTAAIDGEQIDNVDQFFGEPFEDGDQVVVFWSLYTQPKPVGTYTFTVGTDAVEVTGTYTVE